MTSAIFFRPIKSNRDSGAGLRGLAWSCLVPVSGLRTRRLFYQRPDWDRPGVPRRRPEGEVPRRSSQLCRILRRTTTEEDEQTAATRQGLGSTAGEVVLVPQEAKKRRPQERVTVNTRHLACRARSLTPSSYSRISPPSSYSRISRVDQSTRKNSIKPRRH